MERQLLLVRHWIRGRFDLTPAQIEGWIDEGRRGLENALRAKPVGVREQYERQLKDLQEA